jgi:hypothetical protein
MSSSRRRRSQLRQQPHPARRLVSRDITDGYGPEEYLIRRAPAGPYLVKAHYYGSRQQTLVGPATVTATVFTDWGRATESRQVLTLRLDQPREMTEVGTVLFGGGGAGAPAGDFTALRPGLTRAEVAAAVGPPGRRTKQAWHYERDSRTWTVHFSSRGKLVRVVERLPGGIENIVVQ